MKTPKVAIIHDWLIGGGAERVVLELHQMFPDAPIYTSCCSDEWRTKLDGKVITGYLQCPPFRQLRKFLPLLRYRWFKRLDLSEFDLIISSSGNGEAKSITKPPSSTHISYSHSVNQFYWRHYDEFMKNPGQRPYWLMRLGLKLLAKPMRKLDYKSAQNVDYFIANSSFVQQDIKKYYERDSEVIFPPVETTKSTHTPAKRSGFVTMSRLVPWKRADLIVEACTRLKLPLTVIGNGPELSKLKKIAGPSVSFRGWVEGQKRLDIIAGCEAFIIASLEPFGIAPIEAMSAGTPVIAYKAGGALDYVEEGKTGVFFTEQSVESLTKVLNNFQSGKFRYKAISTYAERFSPEQFRKHMSKSVEASIKLR